MHEGSCGSHTGGRSLANRARSQGYWWPYMQKDALSFAKKCPKCQKFSPISRLPATELHNITSPWPFARWGLDIVGAFPRGSSQKKFLLIATDYFTKWVEAIALQKIGSKAVTNFLWKHIITRFGIPHSIVSDNGTQFKNEEVSQFCAKYGIQQHFSSVAYPQGNGQAEATNKAIVSGLKRRLEQSKGAWVTELPSVLWAFRTTPRKSTGETPFSLAYGMEAIIPTPADLPTLKSTLINSGGNDAAIQSELDYTEERRETALIRLANYQNMLGRQREKILKPREFQVGDWVLRRVLGASIKLTDGKLGPNWEGPYKINGTTGQGAYYLVELDGTAITNPWNTHHLRSFYY